MLHLLSSTNQSPGQTCQPLKAPLRTIPHIFPPDSLNSCPRSWSGPQQHQIKAMQEKQALKSQPSSGPLASCGSVDSQASPGSKGSFAAYTAESLGDDTSGLPFVIISLGPEGSSNKANSQEAAEGARLAGRESSQALTASYRRANLSSVSDSSCCRSSSSSSSSQCGDVQLDMAALAACSAAQVGLAPYSQHQEQQQQGFVPEYIPSESIGPTKRSLLPPSATTNMAVPAAAAAAGRPCSADRGCIKLAVQGLGSSGGVLCTHTSDTIRNPLQPPPAATGCSRVLCVHISAPKHTYPAPPAAAAAAAGAC